MRHLLLEIPIDDISDESLAKKLEEWLLGDSQKFLTTPNPEFFLYAQKNHVFKSILQKSDLSLPDGVGFRFAISALTDHYLTHRHTGVDLVDQLMHIAHKHQKKVLFVCGKKKSSAEKTKKHFEKRFPGLSIELFDPGNILLTEDSMHTSSARLIENHNHPEIMLVALGRHKQEQFIQSVLPKIPSLRIAVGIGGAFEMISGELPRAPKRLRLMGLEWLWRVLLEPRRIGRILQASLIFPMRIIWSTLKQHRFWRACRRTIPEIFRQLFCV